MADVASKLQTTVLFLSTTVTRTRRHTELTKKTDKSDGKPVLCQRKFSSVFCAVFFRELYCTVLLRMYGALYECFRFNAQGLNPRVNGETPVLQSDRM